MWFKRRGSLFSEMNATQISNNPSAYVPKLMPDDLIEVTVAALDMEAVGPFNGAGIGSDISASVKKNYLIDHNGNIEFPIIGNVKMAGLTRLEATEILKEKIEVYVKDPIVNLKIINFKVTVWVRLIKPERSKLKMKGLPF